MNIPHADFLCTSLEFFPVTRAFNASPIILPCEALLATSGFHLTLIPHCIYTYVMCESNRESRLLFSANS